VAFFFPFFFRSFLTPPPTTFFLQGLDLIEGRVLVEIQEMRGEPLTHQGFEKFCRVSVSDHIQNTNHPLNEHGQYDHDAHGHVKHKYDFAAILNFHFEVEQRSFEKIMVVIEIIHKHRITGEKVEGVIKLPISTLKHGVYEGGWHDVFAPSKGKNAGKKIGQINVRLLLHKEGLSKEQRRTTITKNMLDLDSSTNSLSDSAGSNSGGASKNESSVGTVVAASKTQGGGGGGAPTQAQIEAEARLARLETELARAVQMMSDVAEAVARLSAQ
jgi:hypothetical protein